MERLFHERFSNTAKEAPDRPALRDEQGTLTYGETDDMSSALAEGLLQDGLCPGEAVAVLVSRQKEIVVGALGAMKAGGVFLPLDEAYPDERLLYMMEDAGVRFILADKSLWERRRVPQGSRKVYFFEDITDKKDFQPVPRCSDDPVMILYTSGTTGKPKGVIHRHALLQGVNDWLYGHPGLTLDGKSHMGIMSGFTFVATNVFIFGTLFGGGTVHIAPARVRQSTEALYAYLKDHQLTHIFMPSSLASAMAEDYDTGTTAIFAGGEKLRNFKPYSENTRVYNMYGSTELATIFSIRVRGDETVMPIGYLTKGAEALLVDEKLEAVPEGEVGELLLCDNRMSRGYLNLPEQTAQKWIRRGGKLYFRTGDRMRRDEKGIYYILGRMDNMVKLRGFRIETGEVETQISKAFGELHFPVGQVVVVLRTVNGIEHLACYYEAEKACDTGKLTEILSGFLPSYMLPDLWTRLDGMPRNANGKVIRSELPEPEMNRHFLGALFSEAELRVAEAAGYVLGLEGSVDPDDGFVQLGGDSLRAMELSACLSEQGIKISGIDILSLPSLRDIASRADIAFERLWSVEEYEAVKCDYLSHGEKVLKVLPLTARQDDLICRQLIHPDRQVSERRFMLIPDSHLEENELRRALDTLSRKHPELGASIVCRHVSFFQGVLTDRQIPLSLIDGRGRSIAGIYEKLQQEDEKKIFDLQFSPLFRVALADRGEEMPCLFLMANKAAYGLSYLRRLLSELLGLLLESYPDDGEMAAWRDIFLKNADEDSTETEKESAVLHDMPKKTLPRDVFFYSKEPEKKIFFVHTGNTGSSAYYQLARRIHQDYAFAVIEPYNLYHREDVRVGIENIAAKYIEILKKYQPEGPYVLGGWCYGGVVAHEMACQLEAEGETVEHLIMMDSHALDSESLRKLAAPMQAAVGRSYFETCPLFKELRENGMLDAVVENAERVTRDLNAHVPKPYHGRVTYFKPEHTPAAATGEVLNYWREMMKKQAGNYEKYCDRDKLEVILTPCEHDDMMLPEVLDIIVPKLYEVIPKK